MNLSVIICTHNPRKDYLDRTLDALNRQTLPKESWDLLLIDNASETPLREYLDLSWHPKHRIVVENELGILPARIRGINETRTPYIIFLDDDNVIADNYLEKAIEIITNRPFLGVIGGSITPEYEVTPPVWINKFTKLLACNEVLEDRWSNLKFNHETIPPTAGMCLQRSVASEFVRVVRSDPRRQFLGRRGKNVLSNAEDTDLALTACDIGLGTGQFKSLHMKHLIPSSRLNYNYLIRFAQANYLSGLLLDAMRGKMPIPYSPSYIRKIVAKNLRKIFWKKISRDLFEGQLNARVKSLEIIKSWEDI